MKIIKDLSAFSTGAGFHTALDNFGVGSSFINLIADVPLNDVKLGRGFMEKCEKITGVSVFCDR